jgi:hypothetical protein
VSEEAPKPDLTAARAEVLALVRGSPMSQHPPGVRAVAPLRPLPPEVEARLSTPGSQDAAVWGRVVLPSGALAVVDGVGVGIGAADGHPVLAIAAGILFVPLAALAVFGARFAGRNPSRLTLRDRRALARASQWHSRQSWTGGLATSSERGLVIAAAAAVERIARTAAWRAGRFGEPRIRLDLVRELDQIDEQAHRIALARTEYGPATPGSAPVVDGAWDTVVDRVAALTAYAKQVEQLDIQRADALTRTGDPVRDADLLGGTVRDEMALGELDALTVFLLAGPDDPQGWG